jgi:hypothetical protein
VYVLITYNLLYHIKFYNPIFFGTASLGYNFRNIKTLFVYNKIQFNTIVNLFNTAAILQFVDEVCRKLVAHLLCCWYKDLAKYQVSVLTRVTCLSCG